MGEVLRALSADGFGSVGPHKTSVPAATPRVEH